VDLLSNMLTTLRLDARIFLHSTFCQQWVIDIGAFEIATFHLISHGDCWLHLPHTKPVALQEKDLVVLPHNATHLITSSAEPPAEDTPRNTPADVISGPSVTLICGTVEFSQSYWNPLVEALPEYVIMSTVDSRETTLGKAIDALINECERNESGSEVVIDRLADILFIEVLRNYVKREHGNSFLVAVSDPKISRALVNFHEEPGRNWNVQELAAAANMSRSAFADRFQHLVGTSPMHYVTRWRMQFAHNELTETTSPIGDIAESCGYLNEESFAKTFRKEFGVSPSAVRRRETINDLANLISIKGDNAASSKVLYSPLEANQLRNNETALFIDVRDSESYEQGHIPGAANIPELFFTLSLTTAEGLLEMQEKLLPLFSKAGVSRDKTVIVYEDNLATRYGGSCRGYFQLSLFGHPDSGILDGGFDQWQSEGFPVNSVQVDPIPTEFDASILRQPLATVDDVIMSLDHPDIKLLDTRDREEWLGITSSPLEYYSDDFLPRKGRIPGARWIEWHNFMETIDGISHFKSPEQIRAICAQAGLYPDDDIIVYCFKGARSSNSWVALQLAGFKQVRNYYGSWNEWARNAALPAISVRLVG
jgi:thiosulfate/3-mercaptopyruvate sulfurtransferase